MVGWFGSLSAHLRAHDYRWRGVGWTGKRHPRPYTRHLRHCDFALLALRLPVVKRHLVKARFADSNAEGEQYDLRCASPRVFGEGLIPQRHSRSVPRGRCCILFPFRSENRKQQLPTFSRLRVTTTANMGGGAFHQRARSSPYYRRTLSRRTGHFARTDLSSSRFVFLFVR